MENGELVEFDEPFVLLQNSDSRFCQMVRQVGTPEFDNLMEVAKKAYFRRQKEAKDGAGVELHSSKSSQEEVAATPDEEIMKMPRHRAQAPMEDVSRETPPSDNTDVNTSLLTTEDESAEATETMPLNVDV